jgi:hypothetical protein
MEASMKHIRTVLIGGICLCGSMAGFCADDYQAGGGDHSQHGASGGIHEHDEGWAKDLDVTLTQDDNLNRAQYDRDKVEDISLSSQLSLSRDTDLNPQHKLVWTGFVGGELYNDISELNRATLGGKIAWRSVHKMGFREPLFEWNLTGQYDDYGVDQRDSYVTQLQFFVTRRWTDRITTTLGGDYQWRESDGSAFDTGRSRAFLNVDYRVYGESSLYLTASRSDGELVSSAQRQFCNGLPATDILPLINVATEIEPDEALNNDLCGEWIAYRVDAISDAGVLGFNWPFSGKMSLDISALYADVDVTSDVYYRRTIYRASLLKRF